MSVIEPAWENVGSKYALVDTSGEVGGTNGTPLNETAVQAIPVVDTQLPANAVVVPSGTAEYDVPTANGTGGYSWAAPGQTALGGDLSGTPADAKVDTVLAGQTPVSESTALGGVLTGTLPDPGMAAGAAATNVGALAGDLTGSLPDPTVAKIQGNPVLAGAPATNDALIWNGTEWEPASVSAAVTGGAVIPTPAQGSPTAPTVGELLQATAGTAYTLPAPSAGAIVAVLCPAGTTAAAPVTLNAASGDDIYGGPAGAGALSLQLHAPGLVLLQGISTTAWWVQATTVPAVLSGQVLARQWYAPATAVNPGAASDVWDYPDTTNLAVTFTAPPSGSVWVRAFGGGVITNGAANAYTGVQVQLASDAVPTSATPTVQQSLGVTDNATVAGADPPYQLSCALTGLTPGDSYTAYLAVYYQGTNGSIPIGDLYPNCPLGITVEAY